ncbi:MAG: acetolactate synthase small subunit [Spirochaetales bacterium]|nr:acetolactate synthase small subunit [Spirochaetales bacterium]
MVHTISLLVENHQGVLARIAGLFSGRGYNLESLTVGVTTDPSISRITLVCAGDDATMEQIKKQLNRIIDIIKVVDMTFCSSVDRELALIKINVKPNQRGEIFQIADVFRAKVMDVGQTSIILEITGTSDKIDDFVALLSPYSIIEIARSGIVSMERGKKLKK